MKLLSAAVTAAALALPAAAQAAAPWSSPALVPGAEGGSDAPLVVTQAGHAVLASARADRGPGTRLTRIGLDGTPGVATIAPVSAGLPAAYATDHVALAGLRPQASGRPPVVLATGTPSARVGTPHALPGTAGQFVFAIAGSPGGTLALVTGTETGHRTRTVWVRRGGVTRRALTISLARSTGHAATVAVGAKGDVLVVWEDGHEVVSRHIGRTGHVASVHRLGAGIQSQLAARYTDSGRQEVAWFTQRVAEGDAQTPGTVSYTSAASGHGFTAARVVGRSALTGTGRYVSGPGVRLVGSGSDSSVLAFTVYDGAHFRVQVANTVAGAVQAPETVSPADEDAVMGDLAYARAGGTAVLYQSGVRGADASGPVRVFGVVRPSGLPDFGAPEQVSGPGETEAVYTPRIVVDPTVGVALAAFSNLVGDLSVSARQPR